MAKNIIEITDEMAATLDKVRKVSGQNLTNEKAIRVALEMLDKKIK